MWWDRVIPVGKKWDEVIEEHLDSAKCMLVVWSEKSVASRWVRTEASEGLERNILVPVFIEDVKPPLAFRHIQTANLTNWQGEIEHSGFKRMMNAINGYLYKSKIVKDKSEIVKETVGKNKVRVDKRSVSSANKIKSILYVVFGLPFVLVIGGFVSWSFSKWLLQHYFNLDNGPANIIACIVVIILCLGSIYGIKKNAAELWYGDDS